MNARKYLNSRLGIVNEALKRAVLSGKRICLLVCNEPEFVEELLSLESLFPRTSYTQVSPNVEFIRNPIGSQKMIVSPTMFVCLANNSASLPIESITNYINYTTSLSTMLNPQKSNDDQVELLRQSMILLVVDAIQDLPLFIEPYCETIQVPCMNEMEFKEYVSRYVRKYDSVETFIDSDGYELIEDNDYLKRLYEILKGLNATQIRSILDKNRILMGGVYFATQGAQFSELKENIRKEFEKILSKSTALSIEKPSDDPPAGMEAMKKWLNLNMEYIREPQKAAPYLMEVPKGLIMVGVPGSGKSMAAQYIAKALKISLIRFDFGNLNDKFIGNSEKAMDSSLRMIEALSPCVLLVDEMDKAFSGSTDGHEVTRRLLGKFLTWMQDKSKRNVSCFVFATANDISSLPSEMFRSGRFDAKFFSFMPKAKECGNIFEETIKVQNSKYEKAVRNSKLDAPKRLYASGIDAGMFLSLLEDNICLKERMRNLDDARVVRTNKFFTGSDIKAVIENAKAIYHRDYKSYGNQEVVYKREEFRKSLVESIENVKTFGETNIRDIANIYVNLVEKNFTNVSRDCVLPFEGLDINALHDPGILNYSLNRNADGAEKGKHEAEYFNSLKSNYDKCLYWTLRNTVNSIMVNR